MSESWSVSFASNSQTEFTNYYGLAMGSETEDPYKPLPYPYDWTELPLGTLPAQGTQTLSFSENWMSTVVSPYVHLSWAIVKDEDFFAFQVVAPTVLGPAGYGPYYQWSQTNPGLDSGGYMLWGSVKWTAVSPPAAKTVLTSAKHKLLATPTLPGKPSISLNINVYDVKGAQ